ncbi:MAG: nickel pincer cofactor biosynthesis protein LarC [Anaerolineales bacterium]|nr:nickel pincer cofactor biosynthesis protein LarC [Anaerolineales bacterium]
MKALYFDLIGGASGDMILGALVDSGLSIETLNNLLENLNLTEFSVQAKKVNKNGFSATKVDVQVKKQPPERHLDEIKTVIHNSSLSNLIQTQAIKIFERIAETEAAIHNKTIDQVHLHELGGTDTIIDVVGTLLALDHLGISSIYASPVPMGKGFIEGAHGQIPLPSPATIALLKDIPIYGRDIDAELVTPTAAALLAELVDDFGPAPAMILDKVGYGAGGRDLPIPNLLRVLIGEVSQPDNTRKDHLAILETNLDDLNPEIYPYVIESLFNNGALDVTLTPIHMKKNRPGTQIQVLCEPVDVEVMRLILFRETTTLGIKHYLIDRFALPRTVREIDTPYGKVRVKIAESSPDIKKVSPEYEDCRKLAIEKGIPISLVYQEIIRSYQD